jgi:hypothetical protein
MAVGTPRRLEGGATESLVAALRRGKKKRRRGELSGAEFSIDFAYWFFSTTFRLGFGT